MDLRTQKTLNSINNAFIQLRSKKPLCKITIKELCENAMISKPTFYLHYKDIYDLSDKIENEIINSIISSTDFLDNPLDNPARKYRNLLDAFFAQGQMLNIIFSEDRKLEFSHKLDIIFKEKLLEKYPQYKDNLKFILLVDYTVYGIFHTTMLNLDMPMDILYDTIIQYTEIFLNYAIEIMRD